MRRSINISSVVSDEQIEALNRHRVGKDPIRRYGKDCGYESLIGHISWDNGIYYIPGLLGEECLSSLSITIREKTPDDIESAYRIECRLQDIERKLDRCTTVTDGGDIESQQLNNKVNVHVPGLGLLSITQVKVVEDFCTDMLRDEIEKGWRILAICPQPDQRRPDYILGKSNED